MSQLKKCSVVTAILLLLVLHLKHNQLNAQNLVKNPSFEVFANCPTEFGGLEEEVSSWHQPTTGSTDYFNNCSASMSTEENFIGGQLPFDGNGYAGMYLYAPNDYREYLTSELTKPLIKGKQYAFSFQVSLAEESQFGINEFGVLFTSKVLDFDTKRNITATIKNTNYVLVTSHNFFDSKNKWMEVRGIYTAKGNERFLTIGNFKTNKTTKILNFEKNLKTAAYYYIDMFSVKPMTNKFELDELYVLENLLFDLDGYKIKEKDNKQLNDLIAYLKVHKSYSISIFGHTDNLGTKEHNKLLSQRRAKAVAGFLVKNGLKPNRILWRGFGDKNPIAMNKNNQNRQKNRRVEFIISRANDTYASSIYED